MTTASKCLDRRQQICALDPRRIRCKPGYAAYPATNWLTKVYLQVVTQDKATGYMVALPAYNLSVWMPR